MNTLLFQPGNCPDLSIAELNAVNQRMDEPLRDIHCQRNMIIARCDEDGLRFADELGGIIRVCEMDTDSPIPAADDPSESADRVVNAIQSAAFFAHKMQSDKVTFGLSLLGGISKYQKNDAVMLRLVSARLKDAVKQKEHSVRFVPPKMPADTQLSSVQVEKNDLLDKGCEIVLIPGKDGFNLARTVWVQPFEDYSFRDYGRPSRDDKSGMLPPKLARMLINLVRTQDVKSLLDPFCGSGSMLMEAGLMGLNAIGIDNSPKAIEDTHENTAWLQKNVPDFKGNVQAMEGDARQLHTIFEPLYFDACATEPYLGPPHSRPILEAQFKKWSEDLLKLYRRALGEIRTVCKPGARVVFILPRFKLSDKNEPGALQILADLKFLGYTILDPNMGFEPTAQRASIIYAREKQAVQREIFVLQT